MSYQARVVHHIPGRVRIKVQQGRGNRGLLEKIKEALSPRPGVRRVEVSPTTGSVVISYDPALLADFRHQLAEDAAREDLFALIPDTQERPSGMARGLDEFFKSLSDGVKNATYDAIDLKEIFPFAVGAYAFFFVDRAMGAPLWLSLMIFSFSSYMDLHEPPAEEESDSLEALRAEIAGLREDIRQLSGRA